MADAREFERVAMPHLDAVYRAAYALSGRAGQADDLAQATFLKALERFDTFRPGTNCKAWLLRILRNTWIDRLRHLKVVGTTVPAEEALLAEPPHAETTTWSDPAAVLENFADAQVIAALRELPEDQRLTLFLVDVEEFSQEEVAEITGVAVGTVKSRTSRARAALRGKLEAHARDLGLTGRRS
jgi:RNA polymerase sigma-70 factor (ECF subfamily)